MVIKLGPPVLESSTKIINFTPPLVPNTNFVKRELKADHPGGSNWETTILKPAVTSTILSAGTDLVCLIISYTLL